MGETPKTRNRNLMQKKIFYVGLFLLLSSLPSIAGQYQVLRVVDGDTIDINYNGTKERIRLLCVDTPESVHPDQSKNTTMGRKASDYPKSGCPANSLTLNSKPKPGANMAASWPMSSWMGKITTLCLSGRDGPPIIPNTERVSATIPHSCLLKKRPGHKGQIYGLGRCLISAIRIYHVSWSMGTLRV